jgi:hypothetical protein
MDGRRWRILTVSLAARTSMLCDWRSMARSGELAIKPYDSGMTVVDRPTISGQFLGRFPAISLPII